MIRKTLFGKLRDGRPVFRYELESSDGMRVALINYGAIVTSIVVPDREGRFDDVVLGYDSLEGYLADPYFMGSIVGRYGNRIANGKFRLNGHMFHLRLNDGPNHLHGGPDGFYRVMWNEVSSAGAAVQLAYESLDGEEGYPGNLTIRVTYELTGEGGLQIRYEAETDKPTILNPTHHSYFNLSGDSSKSVLDHTISISADRYTPLNKQRIPTGELAEVSGTAMDLRQPVPLCKNIGSDFEQIIIGRGFDHNYVLNGGSGRVRKTASVHEKGCGRLMEVFTDQPGMQFYSGNFLDGSMIGKNKQPLSYRCGLCLEAQNFPDAPNQPAFPSSALMPGEKYRQVTVYKFSTD
jgi:aldose 1-epimerase